MLRKTTSKRESQRVGSRATRSSGHTTKKQRVRNSVSKPHAQRPRANKSNVYGTALANHMPNATGSGKKYGAGAYAASAGEKAGLFREGSFSWPWALGPA